jgi:hypothetical protein
MTKTYAVGDTITYRNFLGQSITGTVVNKYDDIKNGCPGFDMEATDGFSVWGYDSQIVSVP